MQTLHCRVLRVHQIAQCNVLKIHQIRVASTPDSERCKEQTHFMPAMHLRCTGVTSRCNSCPWHKFNLMLIWDPTHPQLPPTETASRDIALNRFRILQLSFVKIIWLPYSTLHNSWDIFSKCKCLRERNVKKNQNDGHFKWQARLWPSSSPTLWLIFFGKGEREGAD